MKFAHGEPAQAEPELAFDAKARICETCRWKSKDFFECDHPLTREWSPVRGYMKSCCASLRTNGGTCGPVGNLWEPKQPKERSPLFYAWLFLALVAGWAVTWGWLHGIF